MSRLIMGKTRVIMWAVGVIDLLAKSPDPPSRARSLQQCLAFTYRCLGGNRGILSGSLCG